MAKYNNITALAFIFGGYDMQQHYKKAAAEIPPEMIEKKAREIFPAEYTAEIEKSVFTAVNDIISNL